MSCYWEKMWGRGFNEGTQRCHVTEEKCEDGVIVRVRKEVTLLWKNLGTWL